MVDLSKVVDLGGNTLLISDVQLVTGPGQSSGTSLGSLTGNVTVPAGRTVDLDSAPATLTSNAVTLTKYAGVITSEALTTAAGSSQAFVITKVGIAAGDLAFVTRAGGTNTRQSYAYNAITTTDTVTVTVYNNEPTNALNGTLIFNLWVLKA